MDPVDKVIEFAEKLGNTSARSDMALQVAEEALKIARECYVELMAFKKSTHKIEYVDPFTASQLSSSVTSTPSNTSVPLETPTEEVVSPPKVSPFNFSPGKLRSAEITDEVEEQLWDDAVA